MHFHAWRAGLKTGMYYLRSQPAAEAIKFTVRQQKEKRSPSSRGDDAPNEDEGAATESCALGSGGSDCEACSG